MVDLITLARFDVTDGANPQVGLIADAAGDLFGTTGGSGTVFEVMKTTAGYADAPTTLANLTGLGVASALIADSAGNLLGTVLGGFSGGSVGAVFEITYDNGTYTSIPTLISVGPGSNPFGGLTMDAAGNLFGTTEYGGANNDGTVFEISNSVGNYAANATILDSFYGSNIAEPKGALFVDGNGNLFGTTAGNGSTLLGTVFEIAKTGTGYASIPTTLVTFNGYDGATPNGGLIADSAGDLFGTTYAGGDDDGTVFEITDTDGSYASAPVTLVSFNYMDGANPTGGLIIDAAGDLFGTTSDGGTGAFGTVFEIAKTGGGYASTPMILVNFDGTNGATASGNLLVDGDGDFFGTTVSGNENAGSVYEITGTGYVACYRQGTRIATPSGECAIEQLQPGDHVVSVFGGTVPVVWIGHRRLGCGRHPRPCDVMPVCIRACAFGDGKPYRDLYLSPDHAVYVDNILIPVRYLINGSTIVQESITEVTYYHIELPAHDVILAEGLPCESYLDTGNRAAFVNGGSTVTLHADFACCAWVTKACAELVVGGPRLVAVKQRLLAEATSDRWEITQNADLCIVVDHRRIPAVVHDGTYEIFVPSSARLARLISRVCVPAHVIPAQDDTRRLGVAISGLRIDGRSFSMEDPVLISGWHKPEAKWRWTNGDAVLALVGARRLAIDVAVVGNYWKKRRPEKRLVA